MTMVGDMFNYGLKATVSGLCSELSSLLSSQQIFVPLPPQSARGGFIRDGMTRRVRHFITEALRVP